MNTPRWNRFSVAGVAFGAGLFLAGLGAGLTALAPSATVSGYTARMIPTLAIIPALILAFNLLCDRLGRRSTAKQPQVAPPYRRASRDVNALPNRDARYVGSDFIVLTAHFSRAGLAPRRKWWVGQ